MKLGAEFLAVDIDHHQLAFFFLVPELPAVARRGFLQEGAVIVVGHETDFHAFLFLSGLEVATPGDVAGVTLGFFAEGKQRAAELVLAEAEEEIGLVFALVEAALEKVTAHAL